MERRSWKDASGQSSAGLTGITYRLHTGEAPVYIYDRLDEPTRSILEGELADMEGGEACATFASGMAAISGIMGSILEKGDEVIAHPVLYGCTHSLLTLWYPRQGFGVQRIDLNDIAKLKKRISDKTRILYLESPVNPSLELIDIGALRKLATHRRKKWAFSAHVR